MMPDVYRALGITENNSDRTKDVANILNCIPADVPGAWVIDSVGTLPAYRKKGIAKKMLEAILQKGRKLGFQKAQIKMYIGNIPAQNVYEKMGFQVIEEKRDNDFQKEIGSPGMLSLVRDL
jgi:GNAT superfamily N-acetyltransferase